MNCAAPSRWLGAADLPLDWNGPVTRQFAPFAVGDLEKPIFELFEAVAELHGEKIAIADSLSSLTYAQALAIVRGLAARIAAETRAGDLVGILLSESAEFPLAMLACMAAGRVFVPLDLHYPRQWIVDVMDDAGMSAVVGYFGAAEVADLVPPAVRKIELAPLMRAPRDASAQFTPSGPDDPAIVIYTSGSTGRPKGIVNSQRNLLRRVEQYINAAHIGADDRFMPFSSACTVAGLRERFSALLSGAGLHLLDVPRSSVRQILRALDEAQISIIYAVPALLRSLMQLGESAPQCLRVVRVGGDAVLWSDVERLREWLPKDCLIELGYSSTEAPIMQWFVPRDFPVDGARVPIGYPLPGNALAILDDEGRAVQAGETGELVVRSPYVALGRWIDGRCVADGFAADPQDRSCRIQHTGDLVRLRQDGLIDLIGRKDRQLKIRGYRVEPGEIEAALRRRADVLDAAVLPRKIGDATILAAYVVARGASCDAPSLRAFLKEALPPQLQPQRLYICGNIPRLPSAKLDMKTLLARDSDMQAREQQFDASPVQVGDASAVEETVAAIWRDILKLPHVERDADFFDLGGDSLMTLELMLRLEEALGVELPVTMIYDCATIASLSEAIETEVTPDFSPLVAIRETGEGAPLFIVHGVGGNVMELFGFGRQLICPVYGLQAKGLDGRASPNRSVGDMAEYYLAAIREKQPHGPYRLSGYSSGGLIAFEMAQRLRVQGEDVALLALLDTQTHASQWPLAIWIAKMGQRARHHLSALTKLSPGDMLEYGVRSLGSLYHRLTRRMGSTRAGGNDAGLPPALRNVYRATIGAVAAYRPASYAGPVTLLKSELGDSVMADPARIWKNYARMLQTHIVPGDHRSMIRGANAAKLAETLNLCLAASR